jgi:segregation and condensation protein B
LDNLVAYIESLIFAAEQPVTRKEMRYALENAFDTRIAKETFEEALGKLMARYKSDEFAIEIVEIAGGFQFLTKPAYHHVIGSYLRQITKKRLSRVALETLAIIAYKQPVTKSELEKIRGVNCDYSIQKLLDKELVEISGRAEGPGRPLLYTTTEKFMDYFGLKGLADLPKLKEFEQPDNAIGQPAPEEELPAETSPTGDEVPAEADQID